MSKSASITRADWPSPIRMPVSVAAKIRKGKIDSSPEKAMKPAMAEPSLRLKRSTASQRTAKLRFSGPITGTAGRP